MRYKSTKDYPLYVNSKLTLQPWEIVEIDNSDITNELYKLIDFGWLKKIEDESVINTVEDTKPSDIVYNKIEPINPVDLHKPKIQPQLLEEFVKTDDEDEAPLERIVRLPKIKVVGPTEPVSEETSAVVNKPPTSKSVKKKTTTRKKSN